VDGVASRVEPTAGGPRSSRNLVSLGLEGRRRTELGPWRFDWRAAAAGQAGRTAGADWQLSSGLAALGIAHGGLEGELSWQGRSLSGDPASADRLRLGGLPATVLPAAAAAQRLFEPALPEGALLGDRAQSWRVAVGRRGSALRPFFARHTLRGGEGGGTLELAGVEMAIELPPFPLLRLPELRLEAGAARLLDPPFAGENRGWIALTYRP
jgi:hypothetical protein